MSMARKTSYALIFCTLFFFFCTAYYRCSNKEPLDLQVFLEALQKQYPQEYQRVVTEPSPKPNTRFCSTCKLLKTGRIHHCRVCRKCLLSYDHHCPWLNACVGAHNYHLFYLMSLYGTLLSGYISSVLIAHLFLDYLYPSCTASPPKECKNVLDELDLATLIALSFCIILSMIVFFGLGFFAVDYLRVICQNATMLDHFAGQKPPLMHNLKRVFGDRIVLWLLPLDLPIKHTGFFTGELEELVL